MAAACLILVSFTSCAVADQGPRPSGGQPGQPFLCPCRRWFSIPGSGTPTVPPCPVPLNLTRQSTGTKITARVISGRRGLSLLCKHDRRFRASIGIGRG